MAEASTGFLSRWSRRKTEGLQGKPLAEPVAAEKPAPLDVLAVPPLARAGKVETLPATQLKDATTQSNFANTPTTPNALTATTPPITPEATLSLEDTHSLTKDSDFTPFMAHGVGRDVRNAAMKKLFADPHFNVMDGLDIYIDDYSKSDPIPEAMLRQMNGAKFLNLFPDEEDAEKSGVVPELWENTNNPVAQTLAQAQENPAVAPPGNPVFAHPPHSSQPESAPPVPGPGTSQKDHADIDLRLQPDHASPAQGAGHGTS